MRYLTTRVIVATCTFLVGVTAVTLWFIYRPSITDKLTTERLDSPAAFCDLLEKPDRYAGSVVRVQAILVGYHALALYDPSCDNPHKYLPTVLDAKLRADLLNESSKLDSLGIKNGNFWVSATIIGKLEEISKNYRQVAEQSEQKALQPLSYRFQIVVLKIEHIEAVAPNISWPQ